MKNTRRPLFLLWVACGILASFACWGGVDGAVPGEVQVPAGARPPAAGPRGLNGEALAAMTRRIRQGDFGRMHSLLIYKDGDLAYEEYFDGHGPDRIHEVQSVTKTVAGLLIGIAVDQGKIRGADQKLLELFPGREMANRDAKAGLTLHHVLTMSSGMDWDEHATPYGSAQNSLSGMHGSGDWIQFVLDRGMKEEPGKVHKYNSGGALLLSAILRNSTGTDPEEFARKHLFEPLGIQEAQWRFSSPDGLPHTGGGLYLTPRSMGKVGQLILDEGRWEGRQIVSRDWIRKTTTRHLVNVRPKAHYKLDYGYMLWMFSLSEAEQAKRLQERDIFFAWGADGQFIFIVPDLGIVVVTTAGNYAEDFLSANLLIEGVLAAVVEPKPEVETKDAPQRPENGSRRSRSPDR